LPEVEYCRCIARARVCFLPIANQRTANGHIAIVQAMSLRTLLFTNRTRGTQDYLTDGENCLLFSGKDMDEHARRLTKLYESFATYYDIVERAYVFARVHFSIETEIRLIGEFLEERSRSGDALLAKGEAC
jgi:glycosyltransferase involved in cell wall biosynthesis